MVAAFSGEEAPSADGDPEQGEPAAVSPYATTVSALVQATSAPETPVDPGGTAGHAPLARRP